MVTTLQEAVRLVSSDRAKDRTEGLSMYRRIFDDYRTVEKVSGIDSDGSGNNGDSGSSSQSVYAADVEGSEARWMRILQALFGCVIQERLDCIKKGTLRSATQPAIRRLQDGASVVLFIIERASPFFSHNVVTSAFNHCTQSILYHHELVEPLALPYLKALSVLLSFRPHVEHLDNDAWKRAVALCFSVALLRPVTNRMWDASVEIDELDEDDRREVQKGMLRPEQVEAVNLLRILMQSAYAPLVDESNSGVAILGQYTQLLQLYPTEKSIHIDALTGLNAVIAALQNNDVASLVDFLGQSWGNLLALWNTKSRPLKEQVVMALGSLLPYARYSGKVDLIDALFSRILGESEERHSLELLRLSDVRLARLCRQDAFRYSNLQLVARSSEDAQLSWCVLELGVDCVASISQMSRHDSEEDERADVGGSSIKRRKLLNGASEEVNTKGSSLQRLFAKRIEISTRFETWRKQILLFLVLRHWKSISEHLKYEVTETLSCDVSTSGGESQAWAFMALAEIVDHPSFQSRASSTWQIVTRLTSRSTSTRYAAHLARAIVQKAAVSHDELVSGLDSIIADTCVQATGHATDALCGLFVDMLDAARRDAVLSRRSFHKPVLRWLQRSVLETEIENSGTAASIIDARDLASLCLAILNKDSPHFEDIEQGGLHATISHWSRNQLRQRQAESFILRAEILKDECGSSMRVPQSNGDDIASVARTSAALSEEQRRILELLVTVPSSASQTPTRSIISLRSLMCRSVAIALLHSSLQRQGVRIGADVTSVPVKRIVDCLQQLTPDRHSAQEIEGTLETLQALLSDDMSLRVAIWSRASMQPLLLAIEKLTWRIAQIDHEKGRGYASVEQKSTPRKDDWFSGNNFDEGSISSTSGGGSSGLLSLCFALLAQSTLNKECSKLSQRMWEMALYGDASQACENGQTLLKALQRSPPHNDLSMDTVETVFDWLGDTLAQYQMERDARLHAFAIAFLQHSSHHWLSPSTSHPAPARAAREKGLALSQHFLRLLKRQHLHHSVECDLANFLYHLQICLHMREPSVDATQSALPSPLRSNSIMRALLTLVGSPFAKVWLVAGRQAARLIEPCFDGDKDANAQLVDTGWADNLFGSILEALPLNAESLNQVSCRVWTIGEMLFASSTQRQRALYYLIESVYGSRLIHDHALAVLQEAAIRLGFATSADLFHAFAAQLTWAMLVNSLDIGSMPFAVLGYGSMDAVAKHNFKPMASVLLAAAEKESMQAFEVLCKLARKSKSDALLECSAFVFVSDLTSCVEGAGDAALALAQAGASMSQRLRDVKSNEVWIKCINTTFPSVVVELLTRYYQSDSEVLSESIEESDTRIADRLRSFQGRDTHLTFEPCKPFSSGFVVFSSLQALATQGPIYISTPSVIQGVLIQMTAKIHEQKFVNDQIRLVQALQLFIAVTWDAIISHKVLLAQVLRSLTELLSKAEMFEIVQATILQALEEVDQPIPTLNLILLRHAEAIVLQKLSGNASTVTVADKGIRVLEKHVTRLLDEKKHRFDIAATVAAWPFEGPKLWFVGSDAVTAKGIVEGILKCRRVHVVALQRLHIVLRKAPGQARQDFFSSTIWRLVDEMGKKDRAALDISCCKVLVEILRLSPQGLLRPEPQMESAKATISAHEIPPAQIVASVRSTISTLLVDIVQCGTSMVTLHAYDCLRGIFGVASDFAGAKTALESDQHTDIDSDLSLTSKFTNVTLDVHPRHREELATVSKDLESDFQKWASWFTSLLLSLLGQDTKKQEYAHLATFIEKGPEHAQTFLPIVLHLLFRESNHALVAKDRKATSEYIIRLFRSSSVNREIWATLIAALLEVRKDRPRPDSLSGDEWIEGIDYLRVAECAVECGLYASALLLLEIAKEHHKSKASPFKSSPAVLKLQYSIYGNIEDPDIFYGAKSKDVRDSFVRRLEHEGRWGQVFELRAAEYEASGIDIHGVAESIRRQGFESLAKEVQDPSSTDYEAAWRSQTWSLPTMKSVEGRPTSSQNLYNALRAVHLDLNSESATSTLEQSLEAQSMNVLQVHSERRKLSNEAVRHFVCIQDILQWATKHSFAHAMSRHTFDEVEFASEVRLSILQHRSGSGQATLVASDDLEIYEQLDKAKVELLVGLSQVAREEGRLEPAMKAIVRARMVTNPGQDVDFEFANLLWAQGEHSIAIEALSALLSSQAREESADSLALRSRGLALARLGQWQATACALTATSIEVECFKPALEFLQKCNDQAALAEHCYTYATFAEEQYRILLASDEISSLKSFIELREEEIKQLQELARPSSRATPNVKAQRSLDLARKMVAIDRKQLTTLETSKAQFRQQAGRLYASSLAIADGDGDAEAAVRLVSLLFEHAHDDSVISSLAKQVKAVPSRKLIFLTPQITSRLSIRSDEAYGQGATRQAMAFESLISELCFAMCRDHPFHALYSIYALSKSRSEDVQTRRKSLGAQQVKGNGADSRCEAASSLILRIKETVKNKERIQQWLHLCDSCTEWAQVNLPVAMPNIFGKKAVQANRRTDQLRIPSHLRIVGLRNLEVPVITKDLPLDVSCEYKDFVGVVQYKHRFTTAGGIHLPKIVECVGTDGRSYKQLFKDQDDLRQDAVMQQVFRLVNGLLERDRRAMIRRLLVRTYVVVPLGPQCGLIEFVGNTVPLLAPITELYTRHAEKLQLLPPKARQELADAQTKPSRDKAATYISICQRMPPVFRFYFLERCTDPITYLGCRLNYSRSVATTSIVGHILGLGDRHTSNILLDQRTGEVVHIDFGVAFDQGRLLPIPELVPFRLTPNVIDGMGMDGVEGLYRRGCEETLRVLRQGSSVIKTVLEVFKYDPLYDWTQNPVKVIQGQANNAEDSSLQLSGTPSGLSTSMSSIGVRMPAARLMQVRAGNAASASGGGDATDKGKDVAELLAERAISSVMGKLSSQLSVEYTVNDLIKRARDPMYLGSIFHGWQAAL